MRTFDETENKIAISKLNKLHNRTGKQNKTCHQHYYN